MADCPDTMSWVDKAEEDARAALLLSEAEAGGFGGTIVFHCQQAAEKYLKACLVHSRIAFPRTHDLGQLVTLCVTRAEELAGLRMVADRLQPYAVEARYPYAAPQDDEVRQALADMAEVRRCCRAHLRLDPD